MSVANPIYGVVFKYLMDDEKIARLLAVFDQDQACHADPHLLDILIAERDKVIDDKDRALSEKDKLISELTRRLEGFR